MPNHDVHPDWNEERPQLRLTEAERAKARAAHWDWLRFISLCGAFGVALGMFAATLVIQADISGIGAMITKSPNAFGYKLLLAGGLAHTFGMVSMGIGILIRSEFF